MRISLKLALLYSSILFGVIFILSLLGPDRSAAVGTPLFLSIISMPFILAFLFYFTYDEVMQGVSAILIVFGSFIVVSSLLIISGITPINFNSTPPLTAKLAATYMYMFMMNSQFDALVLVAFLSGLAITVLLEKKNTKDVKAKKQSEHNKKFFIHSLILSIVAVVVIILIPYYNDIYATITAHPLSEQEFLIKYNIDPDQVCDNLVFLNWVYLKKGVNGDIRYVYSKNDIFSKGDEYNVSYYSIYFNDTNIMFNSECRYSGINMITCYNIPITLKFVEKEGFKTYHYYVLLKADLNIVPDDYAGDIIFGKVKSRQCRLYKVVVQ